MKTLQSASMPWVRIRSANAGTTLCIDLLLDGNEHHPRLQMEQAQRTADNRRTNASASASRHKDTTKLESERVAKCPREENPLMRLRGNRHGFYRRSNAARVLALTMWRQSMCRDIWVQRLQRASLTER